MASRATLTMREIAEVEAMCGLSMSQVGEESSPIGKYMAAVGTVLRQRVDPEFTFDAALDMTVAELRELNGEDDDEDPKAESPESGTPTTG